MRWAVRWLSLVHWICSKPLLIYVNKKIANIYLENLVVVVLKSRSRRSSLDPAILDQFGGRMLLTLNISHCMDNSCIAENLKYAWNTFHHDCQYPSQSCDMKWTHKTRIFLDISATNVELAWHTLNLMNSAEVRPWGVWLSRDESTYSLGAWICDLSAGVLI